MLVWTESSVAADTVTVFIGTDTPYTGGSVFKIVFLPRTRSPFVMRGILREKMEQNLSAGVKGIKNIAFLVK